MTISSDIVIDCSILEKNRSKGEKSTSEVAKEYLSRIDNKTLTDILEVYRVDFENFTNRFKEDLVPLCIQTM